MKAKIIVPLITLCLGFIPMLTMSILMNGFWITSPYDFPFVMIPAVLIGDPLLLPPLNYRIYMAIKQIAPFLTPKKAWITVLSCLMVSIGVNSYTHYLWSHTSSTGFMNPQYGVMSFAGYWHYVFSILQMATTFVFAAFWTMTVKHQDENAFKAFEKALYIFIIFILVNISGTFVNKHLFTGIDYHPDLSLPSLVNALTPLVIAVTLLLVMRQNHRTVEKTTS